MVIDKKSAEELAEKMDKAIIEDGKSSMEKGQIIVPIIINLLEAGGVKAIGFNSYRHYFKKRLHPHGVSQSRFYRLKDSAEFCRDQAVEMNDESALSVIAIANAIQNDRARIWNELKEEEGCEIPSAAKIAERIKRNSVTAKDRAKAKPTSNTKEVARLTFEKLVQDQTTNFDQVNLQIKARKAVLENDLYGIERLSPDDLQQFEELIAAHVSQGRQEITA
jgi:hypothetical protein